MPISGPSDISNLGCFLDSKSGLWQDTARTTPATVAAQSIAGWTDSSGNAVHGSQATSAYQPTLRFDANGVPVVRTDGVNDFISLGQPASLDTLQAGSFTLWMCFRRGSQPASIFSAMVSRGPAGVARIHWFYNAGTAYAYERYSGSASDRTEESTAGPATAAYAFGLTSAPDTGTQHYWYCGVPNKSLAAAAVPAVNTTLNWTIGAGNNGVNWVWSGDIYAVCLYAKKLTDAEIADLETWANSYYSLAASGTRKYVVFDGNSLTLGTGASIPSKSYPTLAVARLTGTYGWANLAAWNLGVAAQNIVSMSADQATQVLPKRGGAGKDFLVAWELTNYLALSSSTPVATVIADHWTYTDAARAAGFKVVFPTCLPRYDLNETRRQDANTLVRAQWAAHADALIDLDLISQLSDYNNTTYYSTDKIHLTDAGYALVATPIADALSLLDAVPGTLGAAAAAATASLGATIAVPATLGAAADAAVASLDATITITATATMTADAASTSGSVFVGRLAAMQCVASPPTVAFRVRWSYVPQANDRRDMLEWGLTALAASMTAVASQPVTYARGLDFVQVRATYGKKLLKLSDGQGGTRMEWTDMDFLIDAADLLLDGEAIEPERGDAIYLISGDVVQQFEVAPYGDEPPWRWSDPYHLKYRVHAKHVADEPYAP